MFIVRAEDARIVGSMPTMKRMYTEVMGENRKLLTELMKKESNSNIMTNLLREVN